MAPSTITTELATEADAPALASIVTLAFQASDAAWNIIWGSCPPGTHDTMAAKMFDPVQKEGRVVYKAVDSESGQIVGLAAWMLPRKKVPFAGGSMPPILGFNRELWDDKSAGPLEAAKRDEDVEKDMRLALFFVLPTHQHRGIGTQLLAWGEARADALAARTWLTATPQATALYAKHGWRAVETFTTDLEGYGGRGLYVRTWMVREPVVGGGV